MDDLRIVSAAVSDRGLSEKRPENQDSYLEMPSRGIFAVADGVGGAQAGEVASQMAVEILGEAFSHNTDGDAEETLRAAIERANEAIFRMANELPQLSSMATTIVALHLAGDIATIGHVGDSRLYRLDREGDLHRETDDHSMVAEEVRAGRMTAEQAESHPSRNIISRALGAESQVEVDLKTIMIEPGTAFLACSDGITRHVSDDEIRGVLTFGGEPTDICEYLKNLCYERGAEDNLTAVVVKAGTVAVAADPTSELPTLADDETTVTTARSPLDSETSDTGSHELDTGELAVPENVRVIPETQAASTFEQSPKPAQRPARARSFPSQPLTRPETRTKSSASGKVALALGMLVLGSLIGLATYQFVLAPSPPPVASPQPISEMRTANIPLSAFEENRRNVDADPVGYISKFAASPQDCEDYYLIGRAYLLAGDYANARKAFLEARNQLNEADPVNAKVLASDIAMALAVTNDTTIQTNLRKELDAARTPSNSNVNSIR